MKEWFVTGGDLCGIIVKAESFDDALAQARKINSQYSAARVVREIWNMLDLLWILGSIIDILKGRDEDDSGL